MTIRRGSDIIAGTYNLDEYATKTDVQVDIDNLTTDLNNKANINLSNSTAITNCITEIPQDIKLELNNGTLTLKAGSKVYVPNGFETSTKTLYAWTSSDGYTFYTNTPTPTTDSDVYDSDGILPASLIAAVGDGNITVWGGK